MTREKRVAIQGITASHHEVAARSFFGESIVAVPCLTLYDVCTTLSSGGADVAIVAIENSIAGSMLPNHALFGSRRSGTSSLDQRKRRQMHVDVDWKKRQHYDEALSAIRQQVLGVRILGEYRRAAMVFK